MSSVYKTLCKAFEKQKVARGEFACWVSHVTLWHKLAETDEVWSIFEDDAEFGPIFEKEQPSALQFMKSRTSETFLWMGGVPFKMNKDSRCKDLANQNICQNVRGLTTHAYIMNSAMAKSLIGAISEMTQWSPFDIWLNQQCRDHKETSYCMNPPISQSVPFQSSDIQTLSDKLFKVQPR